MKRREFIAGTAALLVSPKPLRAQGPPRRIGFFGFLDPIAREAWRTGLRERGWIEGKNLLIEYRTYAETPDRMPTLAAELVALTPDLIVAAGPQTAVAMKSATTTIPIVFVAVADPVGLGLVQSLSRPGGNMTGLTTWVPGDFIGKQIEILRELVPGAAKIALLVNRDNQMHRLLLAEEVARKRTVALPIVEASKAEELDTAFASAAAQRADAMIVCGDYLTIRQAPRVVALAAEYHLPAIISSDNSPMADWSSTAPI
jgi:putative tryptophan/tyrosine transport system substrate-binding protein